MAKYLVLLLSLFSYLSFANPLDKKDVEGLEHLARIQTKDFYVYTSTVEEIDIFGVIVIDAWVLINSDTPDLYKGKTYFSSQLHTLVNCETKEVTERYVAGFEKEMGKGSTVFSKPLMNEWSPFRPNTASEKLYAKYCKNKKTLIDEDNASQFGLKEIFKDSLGTHYLLPIKETDIDKKLGLVAVSTVKNLFKITDSPNGPFQSILTVDVCDCKNKKAITNSLKVFTGTFMGGTKIFEKPFNPKPIWKEIPKSSVIEKICNYGCDFLSSHHQ